MSSVHYYQIHQIKFFVGFIIADGAMLLAELTIVDGADYIGGPFKFIETIMHYGFQDRITPANFRITVEIYGGGQLSCIVCRTDTSPQILELGPRSQWRIDHSQRDIGIPKTLLTLRLPIFNGGLTNGRSSRTTQSILRH